MTTSGNSLHQRWRWMLALGMLVGCGGGGGSEADGLVVRDSAGVEIVEHSAAYIAALPVWGVDGQPILELGGGDHPAEEFTVIRSALRFTDGRVLVAEGSSNELRLFGSDGAYLATWARRGEGPGEFSGIGQITSLPGDTVAIPDVRLRRTHFFGPTGEFLRTVNHRRYSDTEGYLDLTNAMPDGRFLGAHLPIFAPPRAPSGPVAREPFAWVLAEAEGTRMDTLAVTPGIERFPGQFQEGENTFLSFGSVNFGRNSYSATDGVRIAIGTNEPHGIAIYEAGSLRRLLRDATSPDPVLEEHRTRHIGERLASIEAQRFSEEIKAQLRANLESNTRFAEVFPWYERLLFGTDGTLWIENYRRYADQGRRFVIYDTAGRAIARAEFPERVRPLQVGPDFLVGIWRDPDDVPYVRVWRVRGER